MAEQRSRRREGQGDAETQMAQSEAPAQSYDAGEELERTMGLIVALGTPAVTVVGAVISLLLWGSGPAVLVLAAGALLGAVVLLWSSLRSLVGDAPIDPGFDEAVVRARVSEANERKRMVLRALKDLENERDIGKIDEADYATLAAEYRARAKAILREMDDELAPQREKAEQIARAHLQRKGILKTGYRDAAPPPDDEESHEPAVARPKKRKRKDLDQAPKSAKKEAPPPAAAKVTAQRRECEECGTSNEPDATFCKKCGARVGEDVDDASSEGRSQESEA